MGRSPDGHNSDMGDFYRMFATPCIEELGADARNELVARDLSDWREFWVGCIRDKIFFFFYKLFLVLIV